LFEAKKRFGLDILNYTVTSNHVHLLVVDGKTEVIPKSVQLVAGKTAEEYNRRKERRGAFWEDRYHATAIETGEHFLRCLVYIDLNMVRNGVVQRPGMWLHGGYKEIQSPPQRYVLINRDKLIACCGFRSDAQLRKCHREWVEEAIIRGSTRQPQWSESIAVGSEGFVRGVLEKLQARAKGRKVREGEDWYELREPREPYNAHFAPKKGLLRIENGYYWKE
jgi:REP element-mobilizing transposase RayT